MIDTHAHLIALQGDIDGYILRAQQEGVRAIINIATSCDELQKGLLLSQKYPCIFHAAATTPHDVEKWGAQDFEIFKEQTDSLVALGETGLDYHYEHSDRELQKFYLRKYAQLAKSCNLPLVIHCREAFKDLFTILDEERAEKIVLHCFTGTMQEAQEVIARGWYLSLSGIVTFKKSVDLKEVARWVPLDRLLIETDAPYLAPQSHRGKINEPAFIVETCRCIAELKGIDCAELASTTMQNAKNIFALNFSK